MLRSVVLGAVSVIALTVSANAADMYRAPDGPGGYKDGPYVPVAVWTGFYVGVNGGYGWSEYSDQLAGAGYFGGVAPAGGFGGGQIGYNWQGILHPHLVLGVEADIQGSGIKDSGTDKFNNTYSSELDYFGTVRGRVGYAVDRALVYFTGGFAYGGVKNENVLPAGGPLVYDISRTATGYVLGGGLEYKITPAWSVKGEYQYINLGKNDPVDPAGKTYSSIAGNTLTDDAFHTVRVGLNYHIGNVYEPLK